MENLDPTTMPRSPRSYSKTTSNVGIATTSIAVPTPLPVTEEDLNAPPATPNLDPKTYL